MSDLSQFNGGQGYEAQADAFEKKEFEAIPPGIYQVTASRAEVRDNYDKNGKDLDITLDIDGPTHRGRKIFKKIRQSGPSADAAKRTKQMGNLASAMGYPQGKTLTSTDEITGAKFDAKVTVYNDKNYAHDLYPLGSQEATHAPTTPVPAQQASQPPAWTPAANEEESPF